MPKIPSNNPKKMLYFFKKAKKLFLVVASREAKKRKIIIKLKKKATNPRKEPIAFVKMIEKNKTTSPKATKTAGSEESLSFVLLFARIKTDMQPDKRDNT